MNNLWALSSVLFLALAPVRADEFRDLFNGKDFDGWVIEGAKTIRDKNGQTKPVWTIEDGHIFADAGRSGFGFLRYSKQDFSDFVFKVEYRMTPVGAGHHRGNSGIGIRTMPYTQLSSRTTRPSFYSYEIQLQDDAGTPATAHCSGSLYRYLAPKANAIKPAPEWNAVEIECVGPHIRVTINDQKVIDVDQTTIPDLKDKPTTAPAPKDKALKGSVCLQSHSGRVEFRNVRIKEIKP